MCTVSHITQTDIPDELKQTREEIMQAYTSRSPIFTPTNKSMATLQKRGGSQCTMLKKSSIIQVSPSFVNFENKSLASTQLLKMDKMIQRKLGRLSRDLSCAFETPHKNQDFNTSPSVTVFPGIENHTNKTISNYCTNISQETITNNIISNSQKILKCHLKTIYKTTQIPENPVEIEEMRQRLNEIIEKNVSTSFSLKSPKNHEPESRLPFSSLGLPTNRKQVELLDNWLKSSIKQINENSEISKSQKVDQLFTIHQFAFLEIVRQISVQCVERGDFLQRLINQYSELIFKYFFNMEL